MSKIDEIEIRSVHYEILDNGACSIKVEYTTPEILPNTRVCLSSLPYEKFKKYSETDRLWYWCREVVFQNNKENNHV